MRFIALAALVVGSSVVGFAQQPRNAATAFRQTASPAPAAAPAPAFVVASIKLNTGTTRIMGQPFQPSGRYAQTSNVALLLAMAYPTMSRQFVGAPAWVTEDRYDIVATAGRAATRAEMIDMIRALLIDRFQLQARIEMREQPVFNLVLAREDGRLGPDIQPSTLDCDAIQQQRAAGQMPRAANGSPACGSSNMGSFAGAPGAAQIRAMSTTASGYSMTTIASTLTNPSGRIVIDRTGLTGLFDYRLRYASDVQQANNEAPAVFTAVQEQLGLRLQPATAPVTVLVIDRIERPTEN